MYSYFNTELFLRVPKCNSKIRQNFDSHFSWKLCIRFEIGKIAATFFSHIIIITKIRFASAQSILEPAFTFNTRIKRLLCTFAYITYSAVRNIGKMQVELFEIATIFVLCSAHNVITVYFSFLLIQYDGSLKWLLVLVNLLSTIFGELIFLVIVWRMLTLL